VLLDTNVVLRHLTGDPPAQARRATALLSNATPLELPDLIVAELVYALQSIYQRPRHEVAALIRAVLSLPSVVTVDPRVLLRALQLYERHPVDFPDAYLAAVAESGDGQVASFDRDLDRFDTITRVGP